MQTLNNYFHVVVFCTLLILLASLQVGPHSVGWPVPVNIAMLRMIVNFIPWILVLALCMLPFGYDVERKFSIAGLMVLTMASSLSFLVLRPGYLELYQAHQRPIIVILTAMVLNGPMQLVVKWLTANIQLPQWSKTIKLDQEFDNTT